MTKLTDMQVILLSMGAHRVDGSLLPPPQALNKKTSQIRRAIAQLLEHGLIQEIETDTVERSWRAEGERHFSVIITDAGRDALAESDAKPPAAAATPSRRGLKTHHTAEAGEQSSPEGPNASAVAANATQATPRPQSKQAKVLELLKREQGASLIELIEATGWLPHTTRAALTGIRKRGAVVTKLKIEGTTRYQVSHG